jgi:hypothetical protein
MGSEGAFFRSPGPPLAEEFLKKPFDLGLEMTILRRVGHFE